MPADRDRPLPPGKLPGQLLGELIDRYVRPDPSVLIGPGIGRDAAAIQVGEHILVIKTDPITFATSDAGRYLVHVNANDIACMGAEPRWLTVTGLLPERSTTPRLAEELFASLATAANEIGVALVGGHTEITIGLDRPILVGQMIGVAQPDDLVDPSTAKPGDAVILCGGIAIEGTAILATQAQVHLSAVAPELLASARALLASPGMSVLPAAHALKSAGIRPRALHDPTEGGIATALAELATSTSFGLEVVREHIRVLPETSAICKALGLDPLGLIASGALLAVVAPSDVDPALSALNGRGIDSAQIGTLREPQAGVSLVVDGVSRRLPVFEVDEIARFFSETPA